MLGYLRADKPGAIDPTPDGWYDTGDIVDIDAQGFITIKGRAKRFAKIAGEMVSLAAVEALASAAWPAAEHAVVAIPDGRKGERLVMLTTEPNAQRETMLKQARTRGATEMSVPTAFLRVDKLPLLGTGKIDYVGAKALALAAFTTADAA
jgi:acyl-[acyl-carrier-protein]-phospholipid O-acyltransferase/long-chain-fatty-acid--[acyl-carrier-protein] ligase